MDADVIFVYGVAQLCLSSPVVTHSKIIHSLFMSGSSGGSSGGSGGGKNKQR
jgi:hypothetical protein